ncbi:MAG: hypothetical protein GY915_02965 [bacterium]|nr:hypothetical protein [bacterium]
MNFPLLFLEIHPGYIFSGFLYALIPVMFLAPKGIVPLFGVTVITMGWSHFKTNRVISWPSKTTLLLLSAAHLWGFLSFNWSEDPQRTLAQWPKIFILNAAGLLLLQIIKSFSAEERKPVIFAIKFFFISMTILIGLDALLIGDKIYEHNKSLALLSLIAGPLAAFFLGGKNKIFSLTILAFGLMLLSTDFGAGRLAFAISALSFLGALRYGRDFFRFLSLSFLLLVLSAPWFFTHVLNEDTILYKAGIDHQTLHYRTYIYGFVSHNILLNPILGYGLNSSNSSKFKNYKQKVITNYKKRISYNLPAIPLHPHNNILQWWLELGGIGVTLIGLLLFSLMWRLRNTSPLFWAASAGFLTTAGAIAFVSFGAWQSWWLTTFWIALIFFNILWPKEKMT